MKTSELKRKYFTSDLWCEHGREEGAHVIECEKHRDAEILRGRSMHGEHITLKCANISYMTESDIDSLTSLAANEILSILKKEAHRMRGRDKVILSLCLGNRSVTSDSQAPLCADILNATYHLKENSEKLYAMMGGYRLAVLCPGTEGQSGIDPSKILTSVCEKIHPDIVIAVDALCASCDEYIGRTIQISSAGITPGSGIGNAKRKISEESTGCITIGLGIPTVISSSTLIYNAFERSGIEDIPDEMESVLENNRSFFVSPKDIDIMTRSAAKIHAETIEKVCREISP